ncbi:hypothetical protein [Lampropedia aestuarii]|uniref:hypothetical protein n=1 Tax=Lampropedia aestuarii TaxID=2562762 RepID=UPI001F0D1596|nr:hypothetical protein [Lampropedia aestuarii]
MAGACAEIFLHMQASGLMAVMATKPGLFFSRLLAHLCPPAIVFLTGLSACLDAAKTPMPSKQPVLIVQARAVLIVLECTLVSFALAFSLAPSVEDR